MKRVVLATISAVFILSAVSITVLAQKPQQTAPQTVTVQSVPLDATKIFNLVNEQRVLAGLKPLVRDARLDASAQAKATDMDVNNYFAHINPTTGVNGYTLIPNGVCSYKSENISQNWQIDSGVVSGWMGSKPHHDAILDDQYDITGIAVSGTKVTQHFCNLK
jgi:uncharacterized protein YkwD